LIIEVPRVKGLPVVLDEGSSLSINFITRGQIFIFPSEIISTISRPFALAFISWPTTVELPERNLLTMTMYLDSNHTIDGLIVEKKGSRNQQGTFYTGLSFVSSNKVEVTDRLTEFLSDIESMPLRL
jgi:hypothetical protein